MENNSYICPTCGNSNPNTIGIRNGHFYCRKCLSFRGMEVKHQHSYPSSSPISLDYDLSSEQKELSDQLVENYKKGLNTLVYAVCGSGKTEIVLQVISYAIRCGEKVAFAIPRKDVVIELHQRLASIFTKNSVISVYGGHNEELNGDIVVLTTHQLYRYNHYFDLVIMDEIDAFPYKGSQVLHSFFDRARKGAYILMSATPSESLLHEYASGSNKTVELFSRFHRYPLPVPEIKCSPEQLLAIRTVAILRSLLKKTKQVMVFTPTIEICEQFFNFLSLFIKGGNCVHSKKQDRSKIISDFKDKKLKYLVTTAVLERGVTVKGLQVIVYKADHNIYDSYSLIQIAGRVGRKKDAPEGRVIYVCNEITKEMERSISEIERANKNLQSMF